MALEHAAANNTVVQPEVAAPSIPFRYHHSTCVLLCKCVTLHVRTDVFMCVERGINSGEKCSFEMKTIRYSADINNEKRIYKEFYFTRGSVTMHKIQQIE